MPIDTQLPLAIDERVVLRRWRDDDAADVAAACSDPEIARWIPLPSPYPVDEARRYIALTDQWWQAGETYVLCVAENDRTIGSISLRLDRERPSIGYWLETSARGRGIMTRAVRAMGRWARDAHGLTEVWIFVQPANVASRAVAERADFHEEAERVIWPDDKVRMLYRMELGETDA